MPTRRLIFSLVLALMLTPAVFLAAEKDSTATPAPTRRFGSGLIQSPAKGLRFRPGTYRGQSMALWVRVPVEFKLH
jgi:hypothetical protein